MKKYLIGVATLLGMFSCGQIEDEYIERNVIAPIDWSAAADSSSMSLVNNFWNPAKHHFNNDNFGNIGQYDYWPEAHGLEVLLDAYGRNKQDTYKQCIYDFHEGVKAKNGNRFWNNYFDDMAWHGVAHLRAFEITGDKRYEESAKALWEWIILEGYNESEGGGIRWNHESNAAGESKGIPSTGPTTIMAARRWQKYGNTETVGGENDSVWMVRLYNWMKDNRFDRQSGRVYEKYEDTQGDWTYNAGTFMGSALELYKITGNQMYLNDAIKIADWTTSTLINSTNKVLSDWAEQEDHDVNLFKGIFVRYFTQLILEKDLPEGIRHRYVSFLKHSAEILWTQGSDKKPIVLFGYKWWEKPNGVARLRAQLSGNMLIEAMGLLEKEGYLK